MSETPTEIAIRKKMVKLVPKVNLETMTTKQFIALLSKKMGGLDLSKKKKYIKAALTEILDSMDGTEEKETKPSSAVKKEEGDELFECEEEEQPRKRQKKDVGGSNGGGGGLTVEKEISDQLAEFLGQGKKMARTGIVKALWEYIKENGLQNAKDRREILLDDKMQKVFKVKRFTMFSMNKYIGAHIYPFTPISLDELSENSKKKKDRKKTIKASKNGKVTRKAGTQAPYRLSKDLSQVTGKEILPRPQVTKALWDYIKKNNLQNPENKREIICDDLLKKVMGGCKRVTMFSMNKYISPHLLEKVDKSEYVHEECEHEFAQNDSSEAESDGKSD